MKKIFLLSAFFLVIVLFTGCLTTLYPIFTEKDLVYKPELVGAWKTSRDNKKDGSAEIHSLANERTVELPGKISSIKDKGYLITYRDEDNKITGSYIAFLARIGKHLYFDYYPVPLEAEKKADEFYMQHFVKMHTPFRVNILPKGGFELSQLEGSYLDKLIEEKKIRIRHEVNSDGGAVITASTEELQQYILKYGDDPEAVQKEKTTFSKN
jgi:hypothetical protein